MGRPLFEIIQCLIAAGWRRRFLIFVPLLLLPPIGYLVGTFGAKTYETRMSILVQEPAKLNPFLQDLAVGTKLAERMPVLASLAHSSYVLGAVANELGMLPPGTSVAERDGLMARLSSALTLQLIGTDLVDLRLRGRSPDRLDEVLGAIGRRFVEKLVAPERSSIAGSVEFLTEQIGRRREELGRAEQRLADFKSQNAAKLPELHAANAQHLAGLREKIEDRQIQLAGAAAAVNDFRAAIATTNPLAGHLEEEIVRLTGQLAQLRARYTDEHSAVQGTLRQLRRLEEERGRAVEAGRTINQDDLDRLWNLAAGTRQQMGQPQFLVSQLEQLQTARARQTTLEQEVAQLEQAASELEGIVSGQSDVERELTGLERDLSTKREVYDTLLKRSEMAQVTGDLGSFEATERVLVIQSPDRASPVGLSTALFALVGVIGGLALGIGLAVAAEFGDNTVRRRSDLEQVSGLRLLARMPPTLTGLAPVIAASLNTPDLPSLQHARRT